MEISLTHTVPDEVVALLEEIKRLSAEIDDNESRMASKQLTCPVCQEGRLVETTRGRILGVVADKWLVCTACEAEWDRKRDDAVLVKAKNDPYGIYASHARRKMSLQQWKDIPNQRLHGINATLKQKLTAAQDKVKEFILGDIASGKMKILMSDISGFIFKSGENAVFSIPAELIEERKRRVTTRSYTPGERNYGGFSFRLARGISVHTGSSSARTRGTSTAESTEYTEMQPVDVGDFVITGRRVLFRGRNQHGFAITRDKIAYLSVDTDQNAIMIAQENRKPVVVRVGMDFTATLSGVAIKFTIPAQVIADIVVP